MSAWYRAAVAVSLLAGFFVVILAIITGMITLTVWSTETGNKVFQNGTPTTFLAVATTAVILVVFLALFAARRERALISGVSLDDSQAPALWALVRELAASAGTRPPDRIRLIAEANAAVLEDTACWGLVPGVRHLAVGVPLLTGLTVDQLKAVLAHELGHYSSHDTRFAEVIYRGQVMLTVVIAGLPPSPWRALLRGYFWVYWSATAVVLRRQEWLADQTAAMVTSESVTASALTELTAIGIAWDRYLSECVPLGGSHELAPDGVLAGFEGFLRSGAADLKRWRRDLNEVRDKWDTHPPMAERVAALDPRSGPPDAGVRAVALIPDLARLSAELDELASPGDTRTRVPLPQYVVRVAGEAKRRDADLLYQAAGTVAGREVTLADVLGLIEDGRGGQFAAELRSRRPLDAGAPAGTALLVWHLQSALEEAAVRSGAARWRHSWLTGTELADGHGNPLDMGELAGSAVQGNLGTVRERLARLGVTPAECGPPGASPDVGVLGGLAQILANGTVHDLLICTDGLVLFPGHREDRRNLGLLVENLRQHRVTLPGHGWRIDYRDLLAARAVRGRRATARFTLRGGTTLTIQETQATTAAPTPGNDPRQILRDLVAALPAAPLTERARAAAPAVAPTSVLATDAERESLGRAKLLTALIFLLAGISMVAAVTARGWAVLPGPLGAGLALVLASAAYLVRGISHRRPAAPGTTRYQPVSGPERIRADPSLQYGWMGIACLIMPPLGLVLGAVSIRYARKAGRRPWLGMTAVLLTIAEVGAMALAPLIR